MNRLVIIGAGTMGHGIAQVAAMAGFATTLTDGVAEALPAAMERIQRNLHGGVTRGKLTADDAEAAMGHLRVESEMESAVEGAGPTLSRSLQEPSQRGGPR